MPGLRVLMATLVVPFQVPVWGGMPAASVEAPHSHPTGTQDPPGYQFQLWPPWPCDNPAKAQALSEAQSSHLSNGDNDRMLLTGLLQGLNESLLHAQEIVVIVRTMIIKNVLKSSTFTRVGDHGTTHVPSGASGAGK